MNGVGTQDAANPLIYANRAYGRAMLLEEKQADARTDQAIPISGRIGGFLNTSAFFMPALLAAYREANPGAYIEQTEASESELIQKLQSDELDLAVMYRMSDLKGLSSQTLLRAKPYAMLPADHPFSACGSVSKDDLRDYQLVVQSAPSIGKNHLNQLFERAGLPISSALRAPSYEGLRGMVAHGFGYAITFTKPACSMSYDGTETVLLPFDGDIEPIDLVMAHRPLKELQTRQVDLIQFCERYFKTFLLQTRE